MQVTKLEIINLLQLLRRCKTGPVINRSQHQVQKAFVETMLLPRHKQGLNQRFFALNYIFVSIIVQGTNISIIQLTEVRVGLIHVVK